jgi:hypothetical protein
VVASPANKVVEEVTMVTNPAVEVATVADPAGKVVTV